MYTNPVSTYSFNFIALMPIVLILLDLSKWANTPIWREEEEEVKHKQFIHIHWIVLFKLCNKLTNWQKDRDLI